MSDAECLVMGLLHQGYHYGHELEKVYKRRNMGLWLKITRSAIYQTLERIEKKGWAQMVLEKKDNFPTRKVYTLTKAGEKALQQMIYDGLGDDELLEFKANMYFSFIEVLPADVAIAQLEKRMTERQQLLEALPVDSDDQASKGDAYLYFIRKHNVALIRGYYELEIQWLTSLITEIKALENSAQLGLEEILGTKG